LARLTHNPRSDSRIRKTRRKKKRKSPREILSIVKRQWIRPRRPRKWQKALEKAGLGLFLALPARMRALPFAQNGVRKPIPGAH